MYHRCTYGGVAVRSTHGCRISRLGRSHHLVLPSASPTENVATQNVPNLLSGTEYCFNNDLHYWRLVESHTQMYTLCSIMAGQVAPPGRPE